MTDKHKTLMSVALLLQSAAAWELRLPTPTAQPPAIGRREAIAAVGSGLALGTFLPAASASGGATSGKTTSIPRAKLRYYNRITAVVSSFQQMGDDISRGEVSGAKAFFAETDGAPFPELKTAGYLLSVAFKIDSKIPPDKIQQVKDFKTLLKDVEKLRTAVSGGKKTEMANSLDKTKTSLNVWLEGVELPKLGDARYNA